MSPSNILQYVDIHIIKKDLDAREKKVYLLSLIPFRNTTSVSVPQAREEETTMQLSEHK